MTADAAELEAIWHDVECGSYAADLAIWDELTGAAGGPVAELGSGTGRVALALAGAGRELTAVERSAALAAELRRRAAARGVELNVVCADARELDLDIAFAAILAPMQFVHLFDARGRGALLDAVARRLAPAGVFAAALLAPDATDPRMHGDVPPPLPDVLERDGWVFSSLPVEVAVTDTGLEMRRLRQRVSPSGELTEELDSIALFALTTDELAAEAAAHGLIARELITIAATDDHVGSVVSVLEARA